MISWVPRMEWQNILAYDFFKQNMKVFETFKNKIKLNSEIKSNEDIKVSC